MATPRERLAYALTLLESRDPRRRAQGVGELVDLAHDDELRAEVAARIEPLLADPQPEVRAGACAGALVSHAAEEVPGQLQLLLRDVDPRVRREAARSLASLEDAALAPALRSALSDSDAQVRFEAAVGLASLRDGAGFDELVQGAGDRIRRFTALGALALLGDDRAIPVGERALGRLFATDFERTQAAGLLARLARPEGRSHLLTRLGKRRADDRGLAMELCGEHSIREAIPLLFKALDDPGDPFRGTAARSLGMLGAAASLERLGSLATDRAVSVEVRFDAMEGLMYLGSPEAREALCKIHLEGESEEVRDAAGDAIAFLFDKSEAELPGEPRC